MVNYIKNHKKEIIKLIESFLIYISISIYTSIDFYSIFSLILFVTIFILNKKYNIKCDSKAIKYSKILSIIFSLTFSVGNIVADNLLVSSIDFLDYIHYKNIVKIVIIFIGLVILFYKLFTGLFANLNKLSISANKKSKLSKKNLIIIFFIILLGWGVLLLRFFPAIMTPDSYYVIHNANEKILSDHHTFGHTWFFAIFFYIGKFLLGSLNGGVFVYTIFQMIIMDLIFTFGIKYLNKLGVKKSICYILTAFIMLNPLYSRYSVTLWRDVLFGMSFIILFLCLYDYTLNNYKFNIKKFILFNIAVLFLLFFRNNGIYVFIFMSPFIVFIGKNYKIKKTFYCLLIIIVYFIIKGPIFDHFNVSRGLSSEAYSIPIQQISRVVASGSSISSKDYKLLSNIYNVDRAKTEYNPILSDKMKETINNKYLSKNKSKFLKIWSKLLIKHPSLYIEAYFTQTVGYWYPDIEYGATAGEGMSFFEKEAKTTPIFNRTINKLIDHTISRKIPFSSLIWSIGLYIDLLIISTFILIYRYGFKYILCLIPFYALWLSLLLATPVFAELRYIFGLFACMPFIMTISLLKNPIEK